MARATVFNRDPAAQAHAFETRVQASACRRPRRRLRRQTDERLGGRAHSGNRRSVRAAWRRHPRHGDDRRLARQGRQPRHHRHRGGARSGAGEGSGEEISQARRGRARRQERQGRGRGLGGDLELSALDIARCFEDAGVAAIIYTDVARDGMLKGINWDATIALPTRSRSGDASGGLASIDDVRKMTEPRARSSRARSPVAPSMTAS